MIALFVTMISYPFGGGEEFMFQVMKWCLDRNINVVWISFFDKNRKTNPRFRVRTITSKKSSCKGFLVDLKSEMSESTIQTWIRLVKPAFIKTQGWEMLSTTKIAKKFRIPVICGYHFWVDLVDLSPKYYNRDILQHMDEHKISSKFIQLVGCSNSHVYVCSEFIQKVVHDLSGIKIPVIHASCNEEKIKREVVIKDTKYILQINTHELKGGKILLDLLRKVNLPFISIQTEPFSEALDQSIKEATKGESIFLTRVEDIGSIYKKTRIMLAPSLVDETFCRTVCEAMANGIPIVTTGKGNISNLVGDSGVILSEQDDWAGKITALYNNIPMLEEMSRSSRARYELFSEQIAKRNFFNLLDNAISSSPAKNVMIIAPFCDQGLGYQTKAYIQALSDYNVHVFSFSPYYGSALSRQKDPSEWTHESVYYTDHTREEITDAEILGFVEKLNIGKCLIPETCWFRIFEIAKLLKKCGVKCYAIPNIEIVRSDEIDKHEIFAGVLANNHFTEQRLKEYGLTNVRYLGFSIPAREDAIVKVPGKIIKFCCIGGMNAFDRKRVHEVCEAFAIASESTGNISLVVTIQGKYDEKIAKFRSAKNIEIIERHQSHKEVLKIMEESDVTIQVSHREGLGLAFYESLSVKTPVLTLDAPFYNEIIKEGENGWLIPSKTAPIQDNPMAIIEEHRFEIKDLADKIKQIGLTHPSNFPNKFPDTFEQLKENIKLLFNE